jgi:hypothetical protein
MTQFPDWEEAFLEVLAETDKDQIPLKLSNALIAIAHRLTAVGFELISPEEKQALESALVTLGRLQDGGAQSDEGAA